MRKSRHAASVMAGGCRNPAPGARVPGKSIKADTNHLFVMATNPPKGDDARKGAVKDRSQAFNPRNDRWVKRDAETGRFMDQKSDRRPFKGVRKEK